MNWKRLNFKMKVTILLAVIMMVLVCFNLLLQRSISNINSSISSIYEDRLLPATEVFYISESLHKRQSVLESYLYRKDADYSQLKGSLRKHHERIASMTKKFEQSYLVEQERTFLSGYKTALAKFDAIEQQIVSFAANGDLDKALALYESEGIETLTSLENNLSTLTSIQTEVGNKLVSEARGATSLSNVLSNVQLALSVVIGAFVLSIVLNAKSAAVSQPGYKWN